MSTDRRSSLYGATIRGVSATPIHVETTISSGMPAFSIVGMPDAAIQESKERIRSAIKACGFSMPNEKIVVNLAPSSLKKTGSGFDLPIALGLLAATAQVPQSMLENTMAVGELSMDGAIKPVRGMLAYRMCAQASGLNMVCAQSAELYPGEASIKIKTASSLGTFKTGCFSDAPRTQKHVAVKPDDYRDVIGHEHAKEALCIAAAGNHGLLMIGPPGTGKSMLASRLPSILPPLSMDEMAQSAQIHSIAGEPIDGILAGMRPFRAPHHSASLAGMCGGGNPIRPGEVTLAHNGVLFLDELPEFSSHTLQSLRQPLENGQVCITRADGHVNMPARFMLLAAMNPCPCGYYGDADHECTCSQARVMAYQNRIGGPLLDRIDLSVDVWRTNINDVVNSQPSTSSEELRNRVMAAREFRDLRSRSNKHARKASIRAALEACQMSQESEEYFKTMASALLLSGRAVCSVLRVARTIADMQQSERTTQEHVAQAIGYRVRSEAMQR